MYDIKKIVTEKSNLSEDQLDTINIIINGPPNQGHLNFTQKILLLYANTAIDDATMHQGIGDLISEYINSGKGWIKRSSLLTEK